MFVHFSIGAAALVTGAAAIATGSWWTLAAVVVVLGALFGWRPTWRRSSERASSAKDELHAGHAAHERARWSAFLGPVVLVAVIVQGWALKRAMEDEGSLGTALLAAVPGTCLAVWALVTEYRHRRRPR